MPAAAFSVLASVLACVGSARAAAPTQEEGYPRDVLPTAGVDLAAVFQGTRLRDVDGGPLDRWRYTQDLGQVVCSDDGCGRWRLSWNLRIDMRLGADNTTTRDYERNQRIAFALLDASFTMDRLFELVDLRLGRLLRADETGFAAFDGIHLDVRRNWWWAAEMYAGTEVKNALGLQSGGYRLPNDNPYEFAGTHDDRAITALYGLALRLHGFEHVHGRLSWQRASSGVTEERHMLSGSAGLDMWTWGRLDAVLGWDLLFRRPDRVEFAGELRLPDTGRIGVAYLYTQPRFDIDSIFAFFYAAPTRELGGHATWLYAADGSVDLAYAYRSLDAGNLLLTRFDRETGVHEVRLRLAHGFPRRGSLAAYASFHTGMGGTQALGSLEGKLLLQGGRWSLRLVPSGGYYEDPFWLDQVRATVRRGFALGALGGAEYRFGRGISTRLEFEANTNPIHTFQFATYFRLDVHLWL